MLQTLSAGKQLDLITKEEIRSLMQEWKVDVARGARPITISTDAVAAADGVARLGGDDAPAGGSLNPRPGFWWAIVRLAVRTDTLTAAGAYSIHLNRRSAQSLVRDVPAANNGYVSFGAQELLIGNSSSLYVAVPAAAGNRVYVSGAAVEIPEQLMWKWLAG